MVDLDSWSVSPADAAGGKRHRPRQTARAEFQLRLRLHLLDRYPAAPARPAEAAAPGAIPEEGPPVSTAPPWAVSSAGESPAAPSKTPPARDAHNPIPESCRR